MNIFKNRYLMILLGTLLTTYAHSQIVDCEDISFENGDLGAWIGRTGSIDGSGTISFFNIGIVNGRHTIMNPGIDPNVGISTVPPGAAHSVRLGNDGSGRQAESLELTFTVTAAQSTFQYQYAVVLEDPNHRTHQQPGLKFKLSDAAGNTIPCSEVRFVAGAGIPGFQTAKVGYRTVRYKDWEIVAVDLAPYIGQQITIQFSVNDCTLGAHFGYSYLTASCVPATIKVSPFCVGNSNVVISAPLGYSSYLWSNGATTPSITLNSPTPGTVYTVTLTSVSGCTSSATATIPPQSPAPPDPVPIIKAPVCGGLLQLEVQPVTGAVSYNWYTTNVSTTPIDGVNGTTYNPPIATSDVTYYVTAINAAGCESNRVAVVGQVLPTPGAPAVIGATVCVNQTATLTINETNTNTYNWYRDPTGGTPFQSSTSKTFTTLALTSDTTFYVSQVNASGCEGARTAITATASAAPTLTIANDRGCLNESAALTVSGGVANGNYQWYDASNNPIAGATDSTYVTPVLTVNTTYFVTAINAAGCVSAPFTVVAQLDPNLAAPNVPNIQVCSGQTATITINENNTFINNWYTAAVGGTPVQSSTSKTFTTGVLTSNVTYYVSQSTLAGCESGRTMVTVTVNPLPARPAVTPGLGCLEEQVTLQASGSATGIYRWFTSTTLADSIVGENGATFLTPSLSQSTTYYVAAVNNSGCLSPLVAVQADVKPTPDAPAVASHDLCGPGSVTLTINETNTNTYKWYATENGTTPFLTTTVKTYNPGVLATTTSYYVSQVSANGCESTRKKVTVTINPIPSAPNVPAVQTCDGETATITVNETNTNTYNWYTVAVGGTPISSSTSKTFTTSVLTANATYYVSQKTAAGCEGARTQVTVTVNPLPTQPTVVSNKGCAGEQVILQASGSVTGIYRWYTSTNVADSIVGENKATYLTPALNQNTTYYVAAVSANGCASPLTTIQADVKPTPGAPAITATEVCGGGVIVLTIQENNTNTYRWYNDATSTTPFRETKDKIYATDSLTATVSYYVSQVSDNGCESPRTLAQAVVNPLPAAPQVVSNEGCVRTSVTLQVSGGADGQYRWFYDELKTWQIGGEFNSVFHTPELSNTTTYYVDIVDAKGCESPAVKVEAIAHPLPKPLDKRDTTVCLETLGNLLLDGGEHTGYLWSTGETTRQINVTEPGVYRLQMRNAFGCITNDSITVNALCAPVVYIPEAFSPNGDGKSDLFKVFGRYLSKIDVMIYNRWGTLVFMSNSLNKGWDGRVNGVNANAGVFRCKVIYTGENGQQQQKQAMIHLVR